VTARLVLENGVLRAEVAPAVGGTILTLRHLATGLSVLGDVPWDAVDLPEPSGRAPDEASWLARFHGGWPVMFPNAGDACTDGATRHGFHGEASVVPWAAGREGGDLVLTRRFLSAPVTMTRRLALRGDRLTVAERVVADAACAVVWGQHVTFGADLLAGPVRIATGAARVDACATYDPPANPLTPGASGDWPLLRGRRGEVSLAEPPEGAAALACLSDFGAGPWAEIHRLDGAVSVRLDWSADPWPLAWLWIETGGTTDAPWFGRGRIIGIEPCSTWPATGLAAARAAGGGLVPFAAGEAREARVSLRVFRPDPQYTSKT
jgi:hypothetical protein